MADNKIQESKNKQYQKQQQALDAAAAATARILDQQEKSEREIEKKRRKEDEERNAKRAAEAQKRSEKDTALLQQDALNVSEAEKQLQLQSKKVIERNVNRAKDIPEPAQFRAIARLHKRAEVIIKENKRFVYQVMNWKNGKKLAIYEINRIYRETLEQNEDDHIRHAREMEDLARAADRNLAVKDAGAEYKAAIDTAQAEYDNEVATEAGNPNAQNILTSTIREIAEGLENEKKANLDQRRRDRNRFLDAIDAETKRYAATIGDAEKLLDEKTEDIEKRYKIRLRNIYERRRRGVNKKPYEVDRGGAPEGIAIDEYIKLINENEPEGRAIEAARKSVKATHAYIKKIIGKAPWIERLAVGKVLSFDKTTHRCVVLLGSMSLYEVDDVCTTEETIITVDKVVMVTKAITDETGKVIGVEEVPEVIKEQQTITKTICHPDITIMGGGNIVMSNVMYGASNPKVGESYTVHIPAVYKDYETALDAGRPWIKVPEGGQMLFYATTDTSLTVKKIEWPLPTIESKVIAKASDACSFSIERQDSDGSVEFDSVSGTAPRFIGVDGLGNIWASHNYYRYTIHREAGGTTLFLAPSIVLSTTIRSQFQSVSGYGDGKRSQLFQGGDGIAPVAVDATSGFGNLLSVPNPTQVLQPRPYLKKINVLVGVDSAFCGTPPPGTGTPCTPVYKGGIAPDGFSQRCASGGTDPRVEVYLSHSPDEGLEVGGTFNFWGFSNINKSLPINQGKISLDNDGRVQSVDWSLKGEVPIDGDWVVRTYYYFASWTFDNFISYPGDEPVALSSITVRGRDCEYLPPFVPYTAVTITRAEYAEHLQEKLPVENLFGTNYKGWYASHAYRMWTETVENSTTTNSRFRVGLQKYQNPREPFGPFIPHSISATERVLSARAGEIDHRQQKPILAAAFDDGLAIKSANEPGFITQIWGFFPRDEGKEFVIATWNPTLPWYREGYGDEQLVTKYSDSGISGSWSLFPKGGQFEFLRLVAASPDGINMLVEDRSGATSRSTGTRAPGKYWQTTDGGSNWDKVDVPTDIGLNGYIIEVS